MKWKKVWHFPIYQDRIISMSFQVEGGRKDVLLF